ncbi:hypothetical protein X760_23570 [Mesorhizobium sp. LSHC422A00]|nr:hypothetical protein X762_30665 [Mesorhizobium sp. LSHC426A00]ESX57040.1 hypothetical protein X760_23570 [Mesorhizobium sp. LSHC422A00]
MEHAVHQRYFIDKKCVTDEMEKMIQIRPAYDCG